MVQLSLPDSTQRVYLCMYFPPISALVRVLDCSPPQILKLHEMNVEIDRPKLLAARRLGNALQRRQASLPAEAARHDEGAANGTGVNVVGNNGLIAMPPGKVAEEEQSLRSVPSAAGEKYGIRLA